MVEQAVEDGGGQGGIVVEDLGPTPSSFKELSRLRHGYRDTKR